MHQTKKVNTSVLHQIFQLKDKKHVE